jgi:hypothetical protein
VSKGSGVRGCTSFRSSCLRIFHHPRVLSSFCHRRLLTCHPRLGPLRLLQGICNIAFNRSVQISLGRAPGSTGDCDVLLALLHRMRKNVAFAEVGDREDWSTTWAPTRARWTVYFVLQPCRALPQRHHGHGHGPAGVHQGRPRAVDAVLQPHRRAEPREWTGAGDYARPTILASQVADNTIPTRCRLFAALAPSRCLQIVQNGGVDIAVTALEIHGAGAGGRGDGGGVNGDFVVVKVLDLLAALSPCEDALRAMRRVGMVRRRCGWVLKAEMRSRVLRCSGVVRVCFSRTAPPFGPAPPLLGRPQESRLHEVQAAVTGASARRSIGAILSALEAAAVRWAAPGGAAPLHRRSYGPSY